MPMTWYLPMMGDIHNGISLLFSYFKADGSCTRAGNQQLIKQKAFTNKMNA